MALFESYERRIEQIKPVMEKYGIKDFDDALKICTDKGFNPYEITRGVQTICLLGIYIRCSNSNKKRLHKSSWSSKSNRRRFTSILYTRLSCRW